MEEFMTEKGRNLLREKIHLLQGALKKLRAEKGEVADRDGDTWHENFAFEQLELQERMLMHQIAVERKRLLSAKTVEGEQGDVIGIGSKVSIEFDSGERLTIEMVGAEESDPPAGKISYQSPLGNALLGRKVGQKGMYSVGGSIVRFKIIKAW